MCYLKADCFKGFGTLFAYLFLNQNSSDFIIQPANKKIFFKDSIQAWLVFLFSTYLLQPPEWPAYPSCEANF